MMMMIRATTEEMPAIRGTANRQDDSSRNIILIYIYLCSFRCQCCIIMPGVVLVETPARARSVESVVLEGTLPEVVMVVVEVEIVVVVVGEGVGCVGSVGV